MDLQKIVDAYVNSCSSHGYATENGDYKVANKEYKKINKYYQALKKSGEIGIKLLAEQLENPNPSVRLWTATYLLPHFEEKSKRKLIELKKERGFMSTNATVTLEEWENGNLKF